MALFVRSYKIPVGVQHMDGLLLEQPGILWLSWMYGGSAGRTEHWEDACNAL